MKKFYLLFFISINCFSQYEESSLDSIIEFANGEKKEIGSQIYIMEDETNSLKINDVVKSKEFLRSTQTTPNIGVSNSTIWLKFNVKPRTQSPILLELAYPTLDLVELYTRLDGNTYQTETLGEHLPFSHRPFNHPNYIFELKHTNDQTTTYFMKIRSGEQILLPLTIGNFKDIFESLKIKDLLFGIYFGIIFAMFFYNLFLYITVRDSLYLYYIVYTLIVGITQSILQGYTFQYLWPNNIWLVNQSTYLFPAFVGFALIGFFRTFLHTKNHAPILDKGLYLLIAVYMLCITLSLLKIYSISYKLIQLNGLLTALYLLIISVSVLNKYKPAKFFLISFSAFLIGVCIYALKDLGILPYNNFTNYAMQAGTALEVVLLSFALADRINILKKEKEESQAKVLMALQENKKLITEQNIILEQKVHERTFELEQANEELNVTLENLKDTQTQLVDAEKMASLGQLTAGIAHEINNPINFVSANVKPLKMDIADLLEIMKRYETMSPNDSMERQLKEIEDYKKEVDLDYIKNEIEILLAGIEDGAKRTAEIVSGLKNFSRLDESDIKEANINEGIESTLILLRSNIPKNVEIIMNLGKIPIIECYPGKLNQVFMNVLNNALDAMAQQKSVEKHSLTISTFVSEDDICVSFEDTGIGMKPEVRTKIFEPFFTTKDVGSGTGLGMSIVFKIMESHHSKIEIESEYGKGTKVLLTLHKKIDFL